MTKESLPASRANSKNYQKKLAILRENYKKKLPEKTAQVEELWKKLRYFNWSDAAYYTLYNLSHSLSGSGKTFGFSELSVQARNLEIYLKAKIKSAKRPNANEIEEISALISALLAAAEKPDELKDVIPDIVPTDSTQVSARSKYRVQIVDDDTHTAEYLSQQLIHSGYQVSICHGIYEIDEQLKSTQIDAVIMDIMFPEGSLAGVEAVERIRDTTGKRTPILFMSARGDVTARLRAVRAGGDAYFTKPITLESLLNKLDEVILSNANQADKVLLIEDDVDLAKHYQLVLEQAGKNIQVVNKPMQTIQALIEFQPDLVLMDINMPDVSGLDLAAMINQEGRFIGLPIIFVSAENAPDIRERALSIGGDEFLSKPVEDEVLIEVVNRRLLKSRRIRRTIKQVSRQDFHLGLIHRKSFLTELEQATSTIESQTSSDKAIAALIYITIESFTAIRKQVGIMGLDSLTDYLAERILKAVGSLGKASQLAETVYVVFAQTKNQQAIFDLTQSIRQSITESCVEINKHKIDIQCSIGFSIIERNTADVTSLLSDVESAAGLASELGVNQIQRTENASAETIDSGSKNEFAKMISEAIEQKSFKLVYQPILNVENDSYEFNEVLCRLIDSDSNTLLPEQFNPIAEQLGMKSQIDRWAISETISRKGNKFQNKSLINYLIPLCAKSMTEAEFLPWLNDLLKATQVPNEKRFYFEIQEEDVFTRIKDVVRLSKVIKDNSCGLVINNFAKSERSLSLLEQLEIDYVKLNDQRISQLDESDELKAEFLNLVDSIHDKGAKIIVGSVENPMIMAILWDFGIRFFQGHHIEDPSESLSFDFGRAIEHQVF
jgi:DNA-binding response OmpR family regulator/EAL domain-containing protein (putative c-di-GMP-specific phosphodiesterase class I)